MSKKVLVLSSSPRKGGNSELLCDQFMAGAKEGDMTCFLMLEAKPSTQEEMTVSMNFPTNM